MLQAIVRVRTVIIVAFLSSLMSVATPVAAGQEQTPAVGNAEFTSYLPKVVQDLMKKVADDETRIRNFDTELASKLAAKDGEIASWQTRYDESERQLRRTERVNDRLFSAVNALATQLLARSATPVERKLILDQLINLMNTQPVPPSKQQITVPIELSPDLKLLVQQAASGVAQDFMKKSVGEPYTLLFSEPFHTRHTLLQYRTYDIHIRIVPGTLAQIPSEYKTYHSFVHLLLRSAVQPEVREDEAFSVGAQSSPKFATGENAIANEWSARIKPIEPGEQTIRIILNGSASPPLVFPVQVTKGNWVMFFLCWLWYWLTKPAIIAVAAAGVATLSKAKEISEAITKLAKFVMPPEASSDPSGHE